MSPPPATSPPAARSRRRQQAWLALAMGAATVPTMVLWRHLPWRFALVLGVAVALLTWSTLQTADRLRRQLGRD